MSRLRIWILPLIWMSVIFYLSHQPAIQSSELSSGITELVVMIFQKVLPSIHIEYEFLTFLIRKTAHLVAYLILGFLIMRAVARYGPISLKTVGVALLFSTLYAISDEVHQLFIVGRSGEVRDVLIDSIGALLGICLYVFSVSLLGRRF